MVQAKYRRERMSARRINESSSSTMKPWKALKGRRAREATELAAAAFGEHHVPADDGEVDLQLEHGGNLPARGQRRDTGSGGGVNAQDEKVHAAFLLVAHLMFGCASKQEMFKVCLPSRLAARSASCLYDTEVAGRNTT